MSSDKPNGHFVLTDPEVQAWWDSLSPDGRIAKAADLALEESVSPWSSPWDGLNVLQRWMLTSALAKLAALDKPN